jgi:hypothetical protein
MFESLGQGVHIVQRKQVLYIARLGWKATEELNIELVLQNTRDLVAGHNHRNSAFLSHHPLSQLALSMGIGSIDLI